MVFMFISNLLTSLFVFKRGFLGSLFIVFVKVIIWVNCRLVHCWAGGKHFFHLKELALLVVIKFWDVGGAFVLSYSLLKSYSKSDEVSMYSLICFCVVCLFSFGVSSLFGGFGFLTLLICLFVLSCFALC